MISIMIDIKGSKPVPAPQKTRVFRNGRSQAVRIPTDHQLRGSEVHAYPDEGAGGPIPSKDGPAD